MSKSTGDFVIRCETQWNFCFLGLSQTWFSPIPNLVADGADRSVLLHIRI